MFIFKYLAMQKNQKEINPILFQLVYNQLHNAASYTYLRIFLALLQYTLTYFIMHNLININEIDSMHLPLLPIFFILVALTAFFILLTLISYYFEVLSSLWINLLLFIEAIQLVYLQVGAKCFGRGGWCQQDAKLQISVMVMMAVLFGVIYLRSMCYNPFHMSADPLSMISGDVIIFVFVYNVAMILLASHSIIEDLNISRQIVFFFTCIIFGFLKNSPYSNPTISRILIVCAYGLIWTSALIYFGPIIEVNIGSSQNINTVTSFWYYWGFSFPIILILAYLNTSKLQRGYEWKHLFFQEHTQLSKELFLQCNNLIAHIKIIRKSQLHIESTEFRQLWNLILHHNENCKTVDCSLHSLSSIKVQRGDQLMELKKFTKTIQKTLEFGLQILNYLKNIYPNSLQLNLEIANYELEVFHQKSKGIQLFNKEFLKYERSKTELWGLYYLKKKIDGFQILKQLRTNSTNQEEIQIFRHDIETSVSMLAQFWFFLSDPKCNLKKLYDLANDLFPMKIKVDKNWKSVRLSKNIQCYNLYAKYLIKLFNDKEKGMKLLEEAQKIQLEKNEKDEILNGEESLNEEHGVIFLQFDGKNSGIMYQVNTACENIFGYNKGELQGRKVNDIMPRIISIHHDKILQNYQQTNKPKMMNKERVIWGKSKNGYLFPFTICIKPVRNYYSQTSEVYASIKRDMWLKQSAFLFTDTDFNISQVSASFIGLYPDLHGRIGLRKKIHISQYIKNFNEVKDKVLKDHESQELIINRQYKINISEIFTETLLFSFVGQEIKIEISGLIGYYFKFTRATGLTSMQQSNPLSGTLDVKKLNNEASNTYLRPRDNHFAFLPDISDDEGSVIVYHGGLLKNVNKNSSVINSRIKQNLEKSKFSVSDEKQMREEFDYGREIKVKRLHGNLIKEVHQLSEQSENNGHIQVNNQEEQEFTQKIKQNELTSIFGRERGNKNIIFLKFLTVLLLVASTLLIIFEYIQTYSNSLYVIDNLKTLHNQQNAQSQVLYANIFANKYYYLQLETSKLMVFKEEINELDSFSSSIPMNVNSDVLYSDNTTETMILSFMINKLISEFQLLISAGISSKADPHLFFVIYNSVNGILSGSDSVVQSQRSSILQFQKNQTSGYVTFIGISLGVFILILILKNIIVNIVIKRKGQILNLFFEIPRSTCNLIQKECEKFVIKLNMDDDEEEQNEGENNQDTRQNKKIGQHKKRTIMGEQKSAMNFIGASLLMLLFTLIYPFLIISLTVSKSPSEEYLLKGAFNLLSVEKQFSQAKAFLDTSYFNNNYRLNGLNSSAEANRQFGSLMNLLTNFQANLYFIGNILDAQYINEYNQLFFKNLCATLNPCAIQYDENVGFNNILYKYFDYIIIKYQMHRDSITHNITLQQLYTDSVIQKEEKLRILFKNYWRRFEGVLLKGVQRFIRKNDSLLFGLMMTFCVLNMSVLMWTWFKFYNSLEEKIIATQYILTFIPIEQINKNPKIVKYIKQQILRSN